MKKLIVTADDFGVFPSVNQGIKEAIINGKVNSVACISNYVDSVKNARQLLDEVGDKTDIGCHLTISSGKPLVVNNNTAFMYKGYFKPFSELDIDEIEKQLPELKKELIAQVEVLKDSNIPVNHLSCHHNTLTTTKALFKTYLEVADHFKFPMRSVNLIPDSQDTNYRLVLRLLLFDDLPAKKRKEIKSFGKEIRNFLASHETKVATPDLQECRHYGPLPMREIWDISIPRLVAKKHDELNTFFKQFIASEHKHGELMLHLIKDDNKLYKEDKKIDYPGISQKYFDSRKVEFDSILKFDYGKYPEVEMASWSDLNPKVDLL